MAGELSIFVPSPAMSPKLIFQKPRLSEHQAAGSSRDIGDFGLWSLDFGLYPSVVSKKSAKIATLIGSCQGRDIDAHYLGYFECFNHGFYYEAHDVLEELWLRD